MNMITFSKGMKTNIQHILPASEYDECCKNSNNFEYIPNFLSIFNSSLTMRFADRIDEFRRVCYIT